MLRYSSKLSFVIPKSNKTKVCKPLVLLIGCGGGGGRCQGPFGPALRSETAGGNTGTRPFRQAIENTTKTTKTKPNQNQSKKPNQNQTKTKPKPNQNQTKTKENRRQPVCQRMENSVIWRVVYTWKSVYVTKRKTRRKTKYWPKLGKIL